MGPDSDFWPDPDSMNIDPKHRNNEGIFFLVRPIFSHLIKRDMRQKSLFYPRLYGCLLKDFYTGPTAILSIHRSHEHIGDNFIRGGEGNNETCTPVI